jgi:hypothetical protein
LPAVAASALVRRRVEQTSEQRARAEVAAVTLAHFRGPPVRRAAEIQRENAEREPETRWRRSITAQDDPEAETD